MSELKIYGHDPTTTAWGTPTPQREPKLKVTVNWATRIVQDHRKGIENRTPLITEPRYEIEGSDFILTDESYLAMSQGFTDAQGRSSSFPFKNPIDYYCTAEPEIYSEGIYQRGYLIPLGDGTGRIVKQFHCNGVATYKTVLHPIPDTLRAWDNGVEITGLTVDEITGLVTGFTGENWKECSCEYRGRYRFDVSEIQLEQIKEALTEFDKNVYRTVSFKLIEDSYDKVPGLIYPNDWNEYITIGNDIEITCSESAPMRLETSLSKKELREPVAFSNKVFYWEHGGKDKNRMQAILTMFNAAKGMYKSIGVCGRFYSDQFKVEQLGVNAFNVEGETRVRLTNPEPFVLEDSNSFNFDLGSVPNGDYPRTVYAPQAVLDYAKQDCGTIYAYLVSATVDNGFRSVQFPEVEIDTLGSVNYAPDGLLFGIGAEIDVLIYQRALGPCYFYGTVRWEVA